MDTLRLVEVTVDGDLVLMTGDGRRFSLSVDEQVRSAVRRSRNGTHVVPGPDRPGPREVQSRIRAGADAEQVALQTGLDVDYVRRFEGPVLAERTHVADLARATAVDRGGDPTLTLERVVMDVLTNEGFDADDISWDSRRSDGSRWEVLAVSSIGSTRTEATWTFDTSTRSLEPVDEEAERLTGVERRRRLSAVRDTVFDVERPSAAAPRGGTVDLLDALARQRGRRPVPTAPDAARAEHDPSGPSEQAAAATGTDDAAGTDDRSGTTRDPGPGEHGSQSIDVRDGSPDVIGDESGDGPMGPDDARDTAQGRTHTDEGSPAVGRAGPVSDDAGQPGSEPDLLSELGLDQAARPRTTPPRPTPTPTPAAAGDRRSKRRRSAVPSWDEIVFGAKREDG